LSSAPLWLWIPLTIGAALAQTVRNAAQRGLTAELGTLGATLVRFLYGLPFAALWFAAVWWSADVSLPAPLRAFFFWILLASIAQIAATALMLHIMRERNFALGVAYAKTEVLQIVVFGLAFLGDPAGPATIVAVTCGMLGALLLAPADKARPLRSLASGWTSRSALLGLGCGALFALTSVACRGAVLSFPAGSSFVTATACTVVAAQLLQTVLLGGWLAIREASIVRRSLRLWRPSLLAGFTGALASAAWVGAYALEPAAHVRTLGLVELLFSYFVAHRLLGEQVRPNEIAGMVLLLVAATAVAL
jgi:drug/metabolite transporter (DMT)-like permease